MWIKFKLLLFTVFVLCFLFVQTGFADNKDKVVARGGDFVMTEGFVRAFQEYYAERGHTTTRKFLVDAALRTKLFAFQEVALDDDKGLESPQTYSPEFISRVVELSEDYVFRLLSEYPVEDKAVVSYYRSYPEKFSRGEQQNGSPFGVPRIEQPLDPELIFPLEAELKGLIRLRVAAAKRQQIVAQETLRLKNKLEIKID